MSGSGTKPRTIKNWSMTFRSTVFVNFVILATDPGSDNELSNCNIHPSVLFLQWYAPINKVYPNGRIANTSPYQWVKRVVKFDQQQVPKN